MAVTAGRIGIPRREIGWLGRALDSKPFLIFLCLLPALGILILFLTYPLGLGVWLAFTDTTIGRPGEFVGLDNYIWLFSDPVFRLAVFNTLFYTILATIGKFALGLWLALMLNQNLPFKSFLRAIMLIPWIVPTVLSALAFWWIYDPQFSIISYVLVDVLGWRDDLHRLPRHALERAPVPDRGQHLARHPVRRDQPARPACRPSRPRSTRRR